MAKGIIFCTVLCTLLHALAASVISPVDRLKLQVKNRYAHLQAEIDEWVRLGKPTEVAFPTGPNTMVNALLVDMPLANDQLTLFDPDYDGNTFFYLYTNENPNGTKVGASADDFKAAGWSPKRPTKFVIHGFGNNIEADIFDYLITALLKAGEPVNAVAVDWGNLCRAPFYIEARDHVSGVGKVVAKLIDALVKDGGLDIGDVHILGHSLGAHVSGNAGKHVSSGKIGRITGLDPAMPLFLLFKSDRLAKDDAVLVDVVHTCAGLLGLEDAIGHVDFYPNGGSKPQPGCGFDLVGSCSHGRSYMYMAESALEPDAFPARECSSTSSATRGSCSAQEDAKMGLNLKFNPEGTGSYYLETASAFPFDLRMHQEAEARAAKGQ